MELEERQFPSYHSNYSRKETKLHKLESYGLELPLKKIGLTGSVKGEIKYHNPNNVNSWKKDAKLAT